jgi:hypothetical protein
MNKNVICKEKADTFFHKKLVRSVENFKTLNSNSTVDCLCATQMSLLKDWSVVGWLMPLMRTSLTVWIPPQEGLQDHEPGVYLHKLWICMWVHHVNYADCNTPDTKGFKSSQLKDWPGFCLSKIALYPSYSNQRWPCVKNYRYKSNDFSV